MFLQIYYISFSLRTFTTTIRIESAIIIYSLFNRFPMHISYNFIFGKISLVQYNKEKNYLLGSWLECRLKSWILIQRLCLHIHRCLFSLHLD